MNVIECGWTGHACKTKEGGTHSSKQTAVAFSMRSVDSTGREVIWLTSIGRVLAVLSMTDASTVQHASCEIVHRFHQCAAYLSLTIGGVIVKLKSANLRVSGITQS